MRTRKPSEQTITVAQLEAWQGKKGHCQLHGDPYQGIIIKCSNPYCFAREGASFGDIYNGGERKAKDEAIQKWNSRPSQWLPIETAPKDTVFDTCGVFVPHHSNEQIMIRSTDNYFSSNTPYPLTTTGYEYLDMSGTYTRTHWMPIPELPEDLE